MVYWRKQSFVTSFIVLSFISTCFLKTVDLSSTSLEDSWPNNDQLPVSEQDLQELRVQQKITQNYGNPEFGELIYTLKGRLDDYSEVAFSPDGNLFATIGITTGGIYGPGRTIHGSWNSSVELSDVATGRLVRTLTSNNTIMESIAFSPDGKVLVLGGYKIIDMIYIDIESGSDEHFITQGVVEIWDIGSGKKISTLYTEADRIYSVTFSPNGTFLAAGGLKVTYDTNNNPLFDNGSIEVWDFFEEIKLHTITTAVTFVESILFSPLGTELVVSSAIWSVSRLAKDSHCSVEVWDVAKGTKEKTLIFQSGDIRSMDMSSTGIVGVIIKVYHSNTSNFDSSIEFWNLTNGFLQTRIENVDTYTHLGVFSPDGALFVTGTFEMFHEIKFWNVSSGSEQFTIDPIQEGIVGVAFSPDGSILASVGYWETIEGDYFIKLWNVVPPTLEIQVINCEKGLFVDFVKFSPDGLTLASVDNSQNTITLWNVTKAQIQLNLVRQIGEISSIALSQNGTLVAICGIKEDFDGSLINSTIEIWNFSSGLLLHSLVIPQKEIFSIDFSPDNTILASSGRQWTFLPEDFYPPNGTIDLWNVSTGELISTKYVGSNVDVMEVIFSSSDSVLVTREIIEEYNSVSLWNVTNGLVEKLKIIIKERRYDSRTGNMIYRFDSITLSPNGSMLALGATKNDINSFKHLVSYYNLNDLTKPFQVVLATYSFEPAEILVKFATDETIIVHSESDIILWSIPEKKELFSLNYFCSSFSFSQSESILALGDQGDVIPLLRIPSFTDFIALDLDNDGMNDNWEEMNDLDPNTFWDKFQDLDNDDLMNFIEFYLGTNPVNHDSDNDSIPDGWEYLMGLNPVLDDANQDVDKDGLPNFWEYRYNFNARNPTDAFKDVDRDGISNLWEYKLGSNPRDFFSVPLFRISNLHILIFIITFGPLMIGAAYLYYSREQKKKLITRLKAPDYSTALKIKTAGYDSFRTFTQAEKLAKALLEQGTNSFFHDDQIKAVQLYEQALSIFERLDDPLQVAETVYLVSRAQKEIQPLTKESSILTRFPRSYSKLPLVQAYDYLIEAMLSEMEKNWREAEKAWKAAAEINELDIRYQLLCQGALIESEFRNWLIDPLDTLYSALLNDLTRWEDTVKTHQFWDYLCEAYLLQARIALATFQFDKVKTWLEQCLNVSQERKLLRYSNKAQKELLAFVQHKERIELLLEKEKSPENQLAIARTYLRNIMEIAEEYK